MPEVKEEEEEEEKKKKERRRRRLFSGISMFLFYSARQHCTSSSHGHMYSITHNIPCTSTEYGTGRYLCWHQHRVWHRPISVLAPAQSMAPPDICAGTSTEYGTGRYLCYLLTHLKCEFNFSHRIFSFFLRPTPFYLTMYG